MTLEIIVFDVDSVLADLQTVWLGDYNKDWKDNLTSAQLLHWDMHKFVTPECGTDIYKYLTAEIYDRVKPFEGARDCVVAARTMARVIFATTAPVESYGRKYQWLKEHRFIDDPRDYVECRDKGLVRGNVLIDDYHENLYKFVGRKILYSAPWNLSAQDHCKKVGINIAHNYDDVLDILRKL